MNEDTNTNNQLNNKGAMPMSTPVTQTASVDNQTPVSPATSTGASEPTVSEPVTGSESTETVDANPLEVKVAQTAEDARTVSPEPLPENLLFTKGGINLIPGLTKEEVAVEEKKSTLNVGAALSILGLVVISLIVIGFNIFTKFSLQSEKETLADLETQVREQTYTIESNNQIVRRIDLYQTVKDKSYSPKEVLQYWKEIAGNVNGIYEIEIQSNLSFTIKGDAKDLIEAAKLWHYFSVDERIDSITLTSLSILDDGSAQFEFDGMLDDTMFTSEQQVETTN